MFGFDVTRMKMPPLAPTPLALRRQQAMLKAIGWLMGVAGGLLVLAVPVLVFLFARLVNQPTLPGSLPPYSGAHADTVHTFLLLGLIGVVGGLTLANGVYSVRHGRQSRLLSRLLILSFGLLMFAVTTGPAWLKSVGF